MKERLSGSTSSGKHMGCNISFRSVTVQYNVFDKNLPLGLRMQTHVFRIYDKLANAYLAF